MNKAQLIEAGRKALAMHDGEIGQLIEIALSALAHSGTMQAYNIRRGMELSSGQARDVMIPCENGTWVSRGDAEHLVYVASQKNTVHLPVFSRPKDTAHETRIAHAEGVRDGLELAANAMSDAGIPYQWSVKP